MSSREGGETYLGRIILNGENWKFAPMMGGASDAVEMIGKE